MNHDIYIWERTHGSLVKILEGPREELGAVEWHPTRPVVAATGVESGRIYFWGVQAPQRWSALAPDFAEVEENVEYVEKEDEFDIHPEEEVRKRQLENEDEEVDVLTVDDEQLQREGAVPKSKVVIEDHGANEAVARKETGLFRMPVLLDMGESDSEDEMIAIGTGQFRRKSTANDDAELWDDDGGETDGVAEVNGNGSNKRR
ncbi:hypothetical protein KC335_g14881 [Hortaea werneckii]|nr:hypothetical protein KC335_g14881 [Hortaea werneckii]